MTLPERVKDIFSMRDQIDSQAIVLAFIVATLEELGVDAQERVIGKLESALAPKGY